MKCIHIVISAGMIFGFLLPFTYSGTANVIGDKLPNWSYETPSNYPVTQVAMSSDGNYLSTVTGEDNSGSVLYYFEKDKEQPLWNSIIAGGGHFDADNPVLAMSSDGNYLVTGTSTFVSGSYIHWGSIILWDQGGSQKWFATGYDLGSDNFISVDISGYGTFIVAGASDNKVYFFKKDSSSPLWIFNTNGAVNSVVLSSNGNNMVAGSEDNNLYYWSQHFYKNPDWNFSALGGIKTVSMTPDGRFIVAGSTDHTVYYFSNNSNIPIWEHKCGNTITSTDISDDGKYITVGCLDNYVYLFNNTNGTPIWSYKTGDYVNSVAISLNGSNIAACGKDQKAYYFSKDSNIPLWSHLEYSVFNSICLSDDGNYVCAGDGNSYVYLFDNSINVTEFHIFIPLIVVPLIIIIYKKIK